MIPSRVVEMAVELESRRPAARAVMRHARLGALPQLVEPGTNSTPQVLYETSRWEHGPRFIRAELAVRRVTVQTELAAARIRTAARTVVSALSNVTDRRL